MRTFEHDFFKIRHFQKAKNDFLMKFFFQYPSFYFKKGKN